MVASVLSGLASLLVLAGPAPECVEPICEGVTAVLGVEPVSQVPVPTDGVLVLAVDSVGEPGPAQRRGRVELAVTLDGQPVAGALEAVDVDNLLLWRPAAPLQPGATYQVTGSLQNPPMIAPECGGEPPAVGFEFTAAAGPLAPAVAPELMLTEVYFDEPILSLTTVVCCDDAMPAEQMLCGAPYGVTWGKGECAPTATRGTLRVQLTASAELDEVDAGQWVRILLRDGEPIDSDIGTSFVRELEEPACFQIVLRSLATGEQRETVEQCVGADRVDQLGVRMLDPIAELAERCATDVYVCEHDGGRWDPLRCTSVEPVAGSGDSGEAGGAEPPAGGEGCGCASAPVDAGQGLLALGLLLLRRRGRASRR